MLHSGFTPINISVRYVWCQLFHVPDEQGINNHGILLESFDIKISLKLFILYIIMFYKLQGVSRRQANLIATPETVQ